MNSKDMTPVLPFSLWKHNDYGMVVVTDSAVTADDSWKITFVSRGGGVHYTIEVPFMEWLEKTSFYGEMPYIGI